MPIETPALGSKDETQKGSARASHHEGQKLSQAIPKQLPAWASRVSLSDVLRTVRPSRASIFLQWGSHVDMRRTLRQWAKSGGIGCRFERAKRRVKPGRLVVLWDVSGSMAQTIPLYLPWLHRLAASSKEVGIFPFGVRIDEITEGMRQGYPDAIAAVSAVPDVWESGTSVGAVLQTWVKHYGNTWLRGRTTIMVISDGWDSGKPEAVAAALREMRAGNARIVWVHPLLRTAGFTLKTRALMAAKPYVDTWFAGGTREDLQRILI